MNISWLIIAIVSLMAVPAVQAATIEGIVYTIDFTPATNVVIEIDTLPHQQIVVTNGSYAIRVPQGTYQLTATQRRQGTVIAQALENISINDQGAYTLDLILFPVFGADEELDIDVEVADEVGAVETDAGIPNWLIPAALILVGVGLMVWFFLGNKTKVVETAHVSSTELDELVAIIRKLGGRTTQKELRKEVPYSEAKVSLMLTELEHKGIVEKIKRGRANVVILK